MCPISMISSAVRRRHRRRNPRRRRRCPHSNDIWPFRILKSHAWTYFCSVGFAIAFISSNKWASYKFCMILFIICYFFLLLLFIMAADEWIKSKRTKKETDRLRRLTKYPMTNDNDKRRPSRSHRRIRFGWTVDCVGWRWNVGKTKIK